MSAPGLNERLLMAQLASDRIGRGLAGALAWVPLVGPRVMRARADELLFVPSDMRPADPSLVDEIRSGQFGLDGILVEIPGGSPFAVQSAPDNWLRSLHGFVWLGSLREAGEPEALVIARRLVADWCRRHKRAPATSTVAGEPLVAARRIVAWIVNAGFLLEDADVAFYRTFTGHLGRQLRALDLNSRNAVPGYPRLAARLALLLAALAHAGHDADLARLEALLVGELGKQIADDGGHISRNPEIVAEILLDTLPIRQCYTSRGLVMPAAVAMATDRMLGHLRSMLVGTAEIARFNGVTNGRPEAIASILALDHRSGPGETRTAGSTGYARLDAGGTRVIVDCGRAPPLLESSEAHAGCLSFELAHLGEALIVNGGAPGRGNRGSLPDARATASHSTLVVAEQSSGRLVRSARLERLIGGIPLAGPDTVTAHLDDRADGPLRLVATHSGYLDRFGLIHERRLLLARDGRRVDGCDILRPNAGTLRLAQDLPVAIHFHLGRDAHATMSGSSAVLIRQSHGAEWRLTAAGCRIALEAATDYTARLGPSGARQIVLRTATPGESRLEWCLDKA